MKILILLLSLSFYMGFTLNSRIFAEPVRDNLDFNDGFSEDLNTGQTNSGFLHELIEVTPDPNLELGYPKYEKLPVTIPAFRIAANEVTYGLWSNVKNEAKNKLGWELANGLQGSGYKDTNENHSVTMISFYDAVLWCNALSIINNLEPSYQVSYNDNLETFSPELLDIAKENGVCINKIANGFRLPTGSEWEVAARGGLKNMKYPWGNEYPGTKLANWYVGAGMPNSTTEVATYLPNGYGLYDMAGGVYEMTWDDNLKPNEDIPDHLKDKMVIKGGTWNAGWTPEVTHGWEVSLDFKGTTGFRIAQNGFKYKPHPNVDIPDTPPGGLVDTKKLLEEARLKEKEINDRLSSKNEEIAKTKEKLEVLRTDKDRLVGLLASLDIELEYCEDEKNSNQNILESIISKRVEKEEKVKSLSDRLSGLQNQNNYLVAQSEQVNTRHTELVQTLESRQEMLGSAHVPNWHYLPDYGWLWTSPEHYPLVYSHKREGWLYYERGTSNPWVYFDYNSQQWEEWFNEKPVLGVDI